MSLPLLAEGEFALVRDCLKAAGSKPLTARGLLLRDNELYAMFADLAVKLRDETALRQYAPLAEETAVRDGHILHQANAHRAWGVLHRLEREYGPAEGRLHQALKLFEALETRWQAGRTLYELGELAQIQSDPAGARRHFFGALAMFSEMKASPDARRTRAALTSLDSVDPNL